jgi:4'-phosphopantetheinyl transferase EntD
MDLDPARLTPDERALFDQIPADREKRRREWWSGRIAAHQALLQCGLHARSVLRDPEGRPITEGAQVAISHGATLAAAAASLDRHVGIDVVDPEDQTRLERIAARVLIGPERELVTSHPQDGLRLVWAAREAIAKATHTGMFVFALTRVHLTAIEEDRLRSNREGIELAWQTLPGGELLVVAAASDGAVAAARSECP